MLDLRVTKNTHIVGALLQVTTSWSIKIRQSLFGSYMNKTEKSNKLHLRAMGR